MNDAISQAIRDKTAGMVELRRKLHAMPELAFQETATAEIIANRMNALGLATQTGIGKTGLVAVLEGDQPGPTLMIRADIDGLPVVEQTGLDFASTNGAMHACGHDGHVAMLITAAEILAGMKSQLKGKVAFLFQPAEETISGAQAMIDDGVLDQYKPDRTIGVHIINIYPAGHVITNHGPLMSGGIRFQISINGPGGHAGFPNLTVDPVVVGSQIVLALQTVISREISPIEPGVITIGRFATDSKAGNIISKEVILEGSARAFDTDVLEEIFDAVKRIAKGIGEAGRMEVEVTEQHRNRPTINNPEVAKWLHGIAETIVGDDAHEADPMTGGEDMSEFLHRVPGAYFFIGGEVEGAGIHHSPTFDFDEISLPIGAELFVRSTLDYLS
jgi:amidohydrolase